MSVRTKRIWGLGVGVVLAVLAAQGVGIGPAAANTLPTGSVTVKVAQSPFDARAVKSFSALCPAGQRVLGGGAFTVGGVHAVITELRPITTATGDSFQVTAAADQFGIAGTWSFQVFAFCATVPASMALEIINGLPNPPTSAGTDQASARCSAGKQLIGAGGKIENGAGQVDLGIFPNNSNDFASGSAAFAKEDADGFAGNYTVTGYSVCAKYNVLFDFRMVRSPSTPTVGSSQKSALFCPSGMELTGLAGATVVPGTHLQQIKPDRTTHAASATFGAQASVVPGNEAWNMDMTLFCAK